MYRQANSLDHLEVKFCNDSWKSTTCLPQISAIDMIHAHLDDMVAYWPNPSCATLSLKLTISETNICISGIKV